MTEELTYIDAVIRISLAVVIGSIVGLERRNKPAGFRTHALVSLGSALFMIASLLLGQEAAEAGNQVYDPSRIASTIVQGVGFIAAGVIFGGGRRITGLTTAASLWVTAAIGLLVGAGFWQVALMGAVATFIVLYVFGLIEPRITGPQKSRVPTAKRRDRAGDG
ncbi:MAG: Mg(2+)-transport-ATPase-associated protein MgtC [uncultured Thermomicrobiales bacterium]|uniref:Mg(2+)-transport-ATPase-associated protein MgtC n=1 Tax=uncultured Thermomicrobiales bacterium TaxID=1645740 RepID=A0A6J4V7G3_9BACT|nr:MAG: Mg(2+)-transport-ATPase-associated protein MgtC [uncultured Thermomicrobiales bacterium]